MENLNNSLPKEIKADDDNVNPLIDIINSIQEKLGDTKQEYTNSTYNISNNTYTGSNQNFNNNKNSNGFDISKLFEMFGGNTASSQKASSASNPFMNLDMETMMRFGKIFSTMNKEDPRKNLLLSLKPFLRNDRQKNVDTYVFILGILNVLDSFNNGNSDF